MPKSLASLAVALALTASLAAAQTPAESASRPLARLADQYYEAELGFEPLWATFAGDNRFDDRLGMAIAPSIRKQRFAMYRDTAAQLKAIGRGKLGRGDAVTYDMLAADLEAKLAFEPFHDNLLPIAQLDSLPTLLANFGSGQGSQPLRTVADYDKYLKRISALPAWDDQAIANMREGIRRGIVQPKAIIRATLPQIRNLVTDTAQANAFYAPIRNMPASFGEADRARLTAAYGDTVAGKLVPSLRKLADFLEQEYLPKGRDSAGYGALPNGDKWYRVYVRDQTTTTLDPEQIHEIGLKEVARIRGEIAGLAPKLGYGGDPAGFLASTFTDARFKPFHAEAEILDKYRAIDARVRARLPDLFGVMPASPLEIRPEPELTRASASDHYTAPAQDGSRPGIFWAVIDDPAKYTSSRMTSLFLHEAQPGHHFHFALQQKMALPRFRKYFWINAFGEGWALYAETLGKEMGFYEDLDAYLGFLQLEVMRAARLVVDTGMHSRGWSREKAIAYWREVNGVEEPAAVNQIERYMAWPGQALGYKIGALKIQELRERARAALGPRFRLAAFHDMILSDGSMPLRLLEAKADRWIAEQAMQ
jgi:uncharacterized protein (DUF885 family)